MGKKYSSDYIIDVYQYMGFCGLECKRKKGVKLSHKAVEKKLILRKESFPFKISTPIHESFKSFNDEDVLRGRVLLVKDDYDQVHPYRRPYIRVETPKLTKEEQEIIRERLIKEELEKDNDSSLKPGELKYQKRKVLSIYK